MGYDKWDRPAIPTAEGEDAEIIPIAESLEQQDENAAAFENVENLETEERGIDFDSADMKREIGIYVSRMLENDDTFGTLAMTTKEREKALINFAQDPELFLAIGDASKKVNKGDWSNTEAMKKIGSVFNRVRDNEKMKRLRGKLGKK